MKLFETLKTISIGSISLASLLSAILLYLVCRLIIHIVSKIVSKALSRSRLDDALKGFVSTAVKAVLWVVAIIIIAGALGINTASLVAVVSIAGLALSLSVQNVMSNLFSGITLLLVRPFKAGDYVTIGANSGTVKSITLFYTVIDTLDNKTISIPNSDVTSASVVNYSAEPLRRVDLIYSASYDSPTEAVYTAIRDAAAQDERILSAPEAPADPFVAINAYKDSAIDYVVRVWCRGEDYWNVYFGMNERVRESFERHGVEMTYNHVNVHMIRE